MGKARTRPEILRIVLGPYVQYCPCEASEQKLGQKPKSVLKGIELSYMQFSNYTAHNNPKSRISRLDWHVHLFY